MNIFLPLCMALLLLAVAAPLPVAAAEKQTASLREEMESLFQHLERKLSLQVEDAALATARQERRLTEVENELKQLREERRARIEEAQKPLSELAEKKKEEIRAAGDCYVSYFGNSFNALGVFAAIIAFFPIFLIFRFSKEANKRLKEMDVQVKKIKETGEESLEKYKNIAEYYIKKLNKYNKKGKKKVKEIENRSKFSDNFQNQFLYQEGERGKGDNTSCFILKNNSENIPERPQKSSLNTLWGLVNSAQGNNKWEKSCCYLEDILSETPEDETARLALAFCQVQLGANSATSQAQREILWEQAEKYHQSRLSQTISDTILYANVRISYAIQKEFQAKYAHSREKSSNLLADAYSLLHAAHTVIPDNINILFLLAGCRYKQAKYAAGQDDKDNFLKDRAKFLEDILRISSEDIPVLQILSIIYRTESQKAESIDAKKLLLEKASNLLEKAKSLDSQNVRTLKMLAIINQEMIQYYDNEKHKKDLRNKINNILMQARKISPHDIEILGLIFLDKIEYFDLSESSDKSTYEIEIHKIFNNILELTNQKNISYMNNIVTVLCGMAHKSNREKQEFLFQKAEILLSSLEKVSPFDSDTLKNFAALRIEQSQYADIQVKKDFLQQAETYLDRINPSVQTTTLYNRACIAALRGQQERALELLEECRKAGTLPPREHLEKDKDMDSLRDLDAFREFLKRAYPDQPDDQADASA